MESMKFFFFRGSFMLVSPSKNNPRILLKQNPSLDAAEERRRNSHGCFPDDLCRKGATVQVCFLFFVSADGIYGIYPKKAFLSRHRSLKTLLGSHRENLGLGGGFNVFFFKESSPLLGGNDEPNWTWTFFQMGWNLNHQPPTRGKSFGQISQHISFLKVLFEPWNLRIQCNVIQNDPTFGL